MRTDQFNNAVTDRTYSNGDSPDRARLADNALARQTMVEQENAFIRITADDIKEANQLSLHCPICAGPVENNVDEPELQPVLCTKCGTLYHRACWEGNGGKCAVLGCDHTEARRYGINLGPVMTIKANEVPTDAQVDRMQRQRLKSAEKVPGRVSPKQEPTPGFWARLYRRILDAFG